MERQPIESSMFTSVGHEGEVMEVEFANGRIHQFVGVEPETFEAFLAAPSKGRHFNQFIRNQYDQARIDQPKEDE